MSDKQFVTISRKWHNPQIEITLTNEAISLEMQMDDFVEALKKELDTEKFVAAIKESIGSITWVVKKETFGKMMDAAATEAKDALHGALEAAIERIVSGVKRESAKVMGKQRQRKTRNTE